jgi:cobalt-zinc-cadmium efflux system protein
MKTEKNILIAFLLNIFFSIFELFGGLITGSVAILSDSVHDIGDAMSIGLSYILEKKSKQKPDSKYTYGYIRYSVMGSIITSTLLLTGSIFVIIDAVKRLITPQPLDYNGMIIISIIGVIVNTLAAMATKEGDSLNQRSVNLHMLEDVLGWVVVLIGSILMKFTDITYIDGILSIGVALFILRHAARNIKQVLDLFLEKTPKNINLKEIEKHLKEIKGVTDIHHVHIRSIDGYNNFMTLHAEVKKYDPEIKKQIKEELEEHGICHSTIELELTDEECKNKTCRIEHHEHHGHHHH